MNSGGCRRSASLTAFSVSVSSRSAAWLTGVPSPNTPSISATTRFRYVRVAQQLDQRPRRRHRAGVVAGEHAGQQHAGDLVLGERAPVGVARLHQRLQEVLALAPVAAARVDDAGDHLDHAHARLVALAERRDRQVRVDVRERRHALLEVVIDRGELLGHALAELLAEQAAARGEVGEHAAEVDEVDDARLAPRRDASARSRSTTASP